MEREEKKEMSARLKTAITLFLLVSGGGGGIFLMLGKRNTTRKNTLIADAKTRFYTYCSQKVLNAKATIKTRQPLPSPAEMRRNIMLFFCCLYNYLQRRAIIAQDSIVSTYRKLILPSSATRKEDKDEITKDEEEGSDEQDFVSETGRQLRLEREAMYAVKKEESDHEETPDELVNRLDICTSPVRNAKHGAQLGTKRSRDDVDDDVDDEVEVKIEEDEKPNMWPNHATKHSGNEDENTAVSLKF